MDGFNIDHIIIDIGYLRVIRHILPTVKKNIKYKNFKKIYKIVILFR